MELDAIKPLAEYGILGLGWVLLILRQGRWDSLLERVLTALVESTAAADRNTEVLQRLLEEVKR